jgi:predicted phosphodiesterase
MKIAVLSDIHSNSYALERVLNHAQQRGVDRFWLLGDIVGYGPHPIECMRWFKDNYHRIDWVMGNHDAMLWAWTLRKQIKQKAGNDKQIRQVNALAFKELAEVEGISERKEQTTRINDAIPALLLNKKTLETNLEMDQFWQSAFSRGHYGPKKSLTDHVEYWIVHGSRRDGRQIGEYIYPWSSHLLKLELQSLLLIYQKELGNANTFIARIQRLFRAILPTSQKKPICQWHGHSHVPYVLTLDEPVVNGNWRPVCAESEHPYQLGKVITLACPGSVGQPRNGDTRASYAVLDTTTREMMFYRVVYDYKKTARDMNRLGYSHNLIERLVTAKYPSDLPPTKDWAECMDFLADQGAKS